VEPVREIDDCEPLRAGRSRCTRGEEGGNHTVEERQRHRHAGASQERAPIEVFSGDEHGSLPLIELRSAHHGTAAPAVVDWWSPAVRIWNGLLWTIPTISADQR